MEHDRVAVLLAVFLAVDNRYILLGFGLPEFFLFFLTFRYRMDAIVAEFFKSLGYPHRVNRSVEVTILAQLKAVEEKQQIRYGEEVVFLRNRLGEEVRLLFVQRAFGVGVHHEVEDLR